MDLKKDIQQNLSRFHPNQTEYHDAVSEIMEDIINYKNQHTDAQLYDYFNRLIEPDRSIRFRVEWYDDNDKLCVNRGYRIQFDNMLGPYKGGLRFHPTVNESILKFLGFEQIFKNALTDINAGGAKGGSDFNPKNKSNGEIRRFCQSFMEELHRHIGADTDIPAGDIGVGIREIGFLYGHYLKLSNRYDGVLTGKHPNFGGSCGREEATGHGCVYFLKEAMKTHGKKISGSTATISGSGNVALFTAEKLIEEKAIVKSVSDSDGCLYFQDGITANDLEKLKQHKFVERKRLSQWKNKAGTYLHEQKPWSIQTQMALACATEHEVDCDDILRLIEGGIEVICEGANMPLTKKALAKVQENNILYLPGKAANAGGVAISGLERSQNRTNWSLTREEVDSKLHTIMERIHHNCLINVDKVNNVIPYKSGANVYSFNKIAETMDFLRGV